MAKMARERCVYCRDWVGVNVVRDERGQPYCGLGCLQQAGKRLPEIADDAARHAKATAAEARSTGNVVPYPEHEKLAKISSESQACGEFVSWLLGEKGYRLGQYHEHTDDCWPEGENHTEKRRTCGTPDGVLYEAPINIRKLLAEYFDINEAKIETEKEAMLDEVRKANAR